MVTWFEIPVNDIQRAKVFYETVLDIKIDLHNFGELEMGWFPHKEGEPLATGTLIRQESYIPSMKGTLVYFASNDVQIELDRVKAAGGKIYQTKTQISPEHGFMGVFIDTEGNRIALHSHK